MDEFFPVTPWDFKAQVSKSYILILRNCPIVGLIPVLLYWLVLILIFKIYLDYDFCLCILSYSSSSNELLLQHFVNSLTKQKIVLEVSG